MTDDIDTLRAVLRTDLGSFYRKAFETVNPGKKYFPDPYIEAINDYLRACVDGTCRRLIVCLPPRSGKSLASSIALPAWMLGREPSKRIICVSYNEDLAETLSQDCRRVMNTSWYRQTFPALQFGDQKQTASEITTTQNGFRFATSIGGTLTGRGGDIIIIDDPLKASDAYSEATRSKVNSWYSQTLYSRLDNKNDGVIIIVTQRTHVDDLVGHVKELEDWTTLMLPAIAEQPQAIKLTNERIYSREPGDLLSPERENEEALDTIRRNLGSANFAAQYQQQPVPASGNMIKREWFKRYPERPLREQFTAIVQSWDTANEDGVTNDYSVCLTFGVIENRYYLLDVYRDRVDFPTLVRCAERRARVWAPDVILIEKAASGSALIQTLTSSTNLPIQAVSPTSDKATRVSQISTYIENGRMYLPTDAPWLAGFEAELLAFPAAKHDDQVDALAYFLLWAIARDIGPPMVGGYLFGGGSRIRDRYAARTGALRDRIGMLA